MEQTAYTYLYLSNTTGLSLAFSAMSDGGAVTPALCSALKRLALQIRYPLRVQPNPRHHEIYGLLRGFVCLIVKLPLSHRVVI